MEGVISDQVTAGIITSPPVEPLHSSPPPLLGQNLSAAECQKHSHDDSSLYKSKQIFDKNYNGGPTVRIRRCILVQTHFRPIMDRDALQCFRFKKAARSSVQNSSTPTLPTPVTLLSCALHIVVFFKLKSDRILIDIMTIYYIKL